jgi:tRNA-specific 2-thiouridylase
VRVLVAMSGGVDSSVAAGVLAEGGHDVVGATLKLWGGASDSGCCSVGDVEDARRVARHLGVPHHVFDMTDRFAEDVVGPYVSGHAAGQTPNPCIECNRHLKFGALLERARRLGFDALATGHHARVVAGGLGPRLARGRDAAKDQSYVLSMLTSEQLRSVVLPVGAMTKDEVRAWARNRGLPTAAKPDSLEVCFIHSDEGRQGFLSERVELHPGTLVDAETGEEVGSVPAVEMVTVGQRRGLGPGAGGRRRFALAVDVARRHVTVGGADKVRTRWVPLERWTWSADPLVPGAAALAQTSAHGGAFSCVVTCSGVELDEPQRLVAPGQTVALYDPAAPEIVVGAGVAMASPSPSPSSHPPPHTRPLARPLP